MPRNYKNDLGKVLSLILGRGKCLLNSTPDASLGRGGRNSGIAARCDAEEQERVCSLDAAASEVG